MGSAHRRTSSKVLWIISFIRSEEPEEEVTRSRSSADTRPAHPTRHEKERARERGERRKEAGECVPRKTIAVRIVHCAAKCQSAGKRTQTRKHNTSTQTETSTNAQTQTQRQTHRHEKKTGGKIEGATSPRELQQLLLGPVHKDVQSANELGHRDAAYRVGGWVG